MKLQILQESLGEAITLASRFVSQRAQLPVLNNIMLSAKNNKLSVSATNLETAVVSTLGAKVEKEGEIAVPSRIATEVVSNLGGGTVNLSAEKELLKISSGGFSSEVPGSNVSDFPLIPKNLDENQIVIKSEDFVSSLSSVLYAVSADETRPVLTGVLFSIGKKNISFVATDGFRLSVAKINMDSNKSPFQINVPRAVLSEVIKAAKSEDVSFSYKTSSGQVVFRVGNTVYSSRIIEGEYPDYNKIIPSEYKVLVDVDRDDLLRAVKLASVFARDNANVISMTVSKTNLEISAKSQSSGSQKTKIDIKVEGEDITISFNYRFVQDFLTACESDNVEIRLNANNLPAQFVDKEKENNIHLIMPVKVD